MPMVDREGSISKAQSRPAHKDVENKPSYSSLAVYCDIKGQLEGKHDDTVHYKYTNNSIEYHFVWIIRMNDHAMPLLDVPSLPLCPKYDLCRSIAESHRFVWSSI